MKYIALIGALILTGCGANSKPATAPVVIQTQPITRPAFNPPPVASFKSRDVDWVVITPQNVDAIFNQMQAKGEPMVFFAITENGYKNIAINNREALRVILQQQAVINGYQEYYVRVP